MEKYSDAEYDEINSVLTTNIEVINILLVKLHISYKQGRHASSLKYNLSSDISGDYKHKLYLLRQQAHILCDLNYNTMMLEINSPDSCLPLNLTMAFGVGVNASAFDAIRESMKE